MDECLPDDLPRSRNPDGSRASDWRARIAGLEHPPEALTMSVRASTRCSLEDLSEVGVGLSGAYAHHSGIESPAY